MRRQMMFSVAVVAIAGAAVAVYALRANDDDAAPAAGAHNHGSAAASVEARPVRLDPEHARRIGVTYATAESGPMTTVVRTVGSVSFDETRFVSVSPKIEGWVEDLYVDFTGAPVTRGQPLMAIYSPMLVSGQEELILARRLLDAAEPGGAAANNARELLEAARRRLAYWDVPRADIERIERTGKTQKTVTLSAPANGLVVEKSVFEGQRIMPGMELYRIADLSTVWVEGEIFERDLGLVALGSRAQIGFESYPGQTFTGNVTYVSPVMTSDSRTSRVRIEMPNRNLQLKPGMYATMEFTTRVHAAGIHIPRSAVLQTGQRAIVFVRSPDGTLVPRQITPGASTTDHIEVLAGLEEGEVVVASANFLVDAESNIGAALGTLPAPGESHAEAGH